MNTHYAVLVFAGDYDGDHPDQDLRGHAPSMTMLAAGPEDFCWTAAAAWTERHPLQRDQSIEVLARDPALVRQPDSAPPAA